MIAWRHFSVHHLSVYAIFSGFSKPTLDTHPRFRPDANTRCPIKYFRSDGLPDIPSIDTSAEKIVRVLAAGGFEYAVIGGLAVVLQGHDRFTREVEPN